MKSRDRSARGARRVQQQELLYRSRGGARAGAGRKPKGERAGVPHISRPQHKARFPLLVTTRVGAGLPSLRRAAEAARVRAVFEAIAAARSARFRIVHHSIQTNHLHLLVEAEDRAALTSGMRGFLIRLARALNRLWGRSGAVFPDRFHERELRTPREVRNALVYVLQNSKKHGIHFAGPDPLSSGPEFDGWREAARGGPGGAGCAVRFGGNAGGAGEGVLRRAARSEALAPQTWLLGVGWRRHGLIDVRERPRPG